MTRVVLTDPTTLVAKELGDQLSAAPDLQIHQIDLVSADEQEIGVLSDIGGAAAMVTRFDPELPLDADLVFCCGPRYETAAPILAAREGLGPVVVFAPDAPLDVAQPFIPWVHFPAEPFAGPLVSPHPGVVMAASLLQTLLPLGPTRAAATVLEPASILGNDAMDEVLAQTRAMLAFESPPEPQVFPTQQAFNVTLSDTRGDQLTRQLQAAMPGAPPVGFQALRAGTFHSVGLSLEIRFEQCPGAEEALECILDVPRHLRLDEPDLLGTADAAAQSELLVGSVAHHPASDSLWIWAAADNLTFGSAANGVELARALLSGGAPN